MRRSPLIALLVGPLVSCGGEPPVVKSPPYAALDGRTTNPGGHFGPEEVGPPVTTTRGKISVVKRTAKEMYYEHQLSEFRYASQTYFTVVREGETNSTIGWYSRVVVTPEGEVYVTKATGMWFELDPATYKTVDRVKIVQLLSDGAPMKGGSGSELFIMFDKPRKERANSYSAKSWDATGTLVKAWDDISGSATGPMIRIGKLDVFFPVGPNGERTAQFLDERHLPKGEPIVGFEELRMSLPNGKGTHSYLARPSRKDPSLYALMLENGTFDTPPELIGMRRMPTKSERAGQSDKASDAQSSVWLMGYETKAGKRWGWAASDFSEQSGPIWSTVKTIEGPELTTLYTGQALEAGSNVAPLAYLVAEDALTKKWNALVPRLPLGSLTKESFASEQEAVAASELACRTTIAATRKEAAEKAAAERAANEATKKAIADRRTNGGATKDKDERWASAMNNWRANFGSPDDTAMQLGGVYLVDWMLERKGSRIEMLERAVSEAKKFDPVAEQKLATMLKVAKDRVTATKKEEEAQAKANARTPAVNYERSTQSSYEPSYGTPHTYDIRTGVRSDTQSLLNWTYGQQNWKPY